jgi:chemotaxis protein MotB
MRTQPAFAWQWCVCLVASACTREPAPDPATTNAALGRLTQQLADEHAERTRCDELLETLSKNLNGTRDELAAVKQQRDEIAQRRLVFEKLKTALKPLIDSGQAVPVSNGSAMSFNLSAAVLFGSGESLVSSAGQEALAPVAKVLADFTDTRFVIAGHTDSAPIGNLKNQHYIDNWELSSQRALQVVRALVARGASPKNLSIAGYGDTQPAMANTTGEGRRANRRIEIVLVAGAATPDEASPKPAAPAPRDAATASGERDP